MGFHQDSYRFRNDDGSETTAMWKAAQNTPAFIPENEIFRFRTSTRNADTVGAAGSYQLQYRLNDGTWLDVNASSSVVRSAVGAHVANGTLTTEQMTGGGTYSSGEYDDNNGLNAGQSGAPVGEEQENENCVQLRGADVVDGDVVELRHILAPATPFASYTNIGTFTVGVAGWTGRTPPDAILGKRGLAGTLADIDDDPDSADASWLVVG